MPPENVLRHCALAAVVSALAAAVPADCAIAIALNIKPGISASRRREWFWCASRVFMDVLRAWE
ncbi:hypothetical protein QE400_003421 [Xanthomonas sacchari]|uniref:hypothetical protein n=1 Tax=Xanthomonas sacchari TaxID=56458 RepID=UPI00277E399F|nr:hypothetical protein [Xanthomonas sacchari]MDQ1094008.1 hypothetical protein [Xanthomonas sacchari]